MHGQSAPVQGQAGWSWQDGPDVWILTSTVVRFLGYVEIFLVTKSALLRHHRYCWRDQHRQSNRKRPRHLLLPGQYHGHDNKGYADPQLECVLET
jgi:hypothetical protein